MSEEMDEGDPLGIRKSREEEAKADSEMFQDIAKKHLASSKRISEARIAANAEIQKKRLDSWSKK